jgi:hypothetical protein
MLNPLLKMTLVALFVRQKLFYIAPSGENIAETMDRRMEMQTDGRIKNENADAERVWSALNKLAVQLEAR